MNPNYQTKKLEEICEVFVDGNWIESKDQSLEGIRLIQTGNIGLGVFKDRVDKARYISEQTFIDLKCTEIFPNDCLVSRLPDPVGRSCIIPETDERMITAVDCTIIRFNKTQVISEFFNYYSQSNKYLSDVEEKTSGTTRKRISRKNLGIIEIPLPPLPEQRRIVGILDQAFAAIDKAKQNAEKNLQNSKELFESYLNAVFENPGDGWEEKKLEEVSTLQRGFDLPKRLRVEGKYPLASSSGIIDTHNEMKVSGPGVFTGRSGSIGNVFYIEDDYWPLNTTLYIKDFHGNNARFIYYLLRKFDLQRFSSGAGVPTLNRNSVHSELVYIPKTQNEQENIATKLDSLSVQTKKLEEIYQKKLDNLEELRQSILNKAFAGEL